MTRVHKTFLTVLLLLSIPSVCKTQTIQRGDADDASEISWSPGNDLILTSSEHALSLWEVNSAKLLWKTDVGFLQDDLELYSIRHFAWTTDQRLIVTGTNNGKLQLWEAASGRLIWNIKAHAGSVTAITINRASTSFVSSADLGNAKSEVKLWNLADGRLLRDLSASQKIVRPSPAVKKIEFRQFGSGIVSHDGSLIATFPSYRADGVQIFDTRTGERRHWLVGHPGVIKSLAFSSDGRMFFSGSADRIVRVWDTQSRTVLFSLEGHTDDVESLEPSSDGKTLISRSENQEIVWDVQRGLKLNETKQEQRLPQQNEQALSPSGKFALVEEYAKPFRLVDALTNATIKEFIFIDQLDNLIFCSDEKHFLAKPWWSGWQLWSVDGNKPIREFDIGYSFYNRVAFHPNGRIFVTGGGGQNIFMFDLQSGEKIWSLFEIDRQEYDSKKAAETRRVAYLERKKEQARLADIRNQPYVDKVHITFEHYGDMTPLGEQKMAESDTPNKSKTKKDPASANAIWLRLHNDSPLPVSIPTQSIYLPNRNCFHTFPDGNKLFGLCDNREISVWLGLEDKDGKPLPYGFDFGSSAILLPGKSAMFAVERDVLRDGRAIRFSFTFQTSADGKVQNYGNEKLLRFREEDLTKRQ